VLPCAITQQSAYALVCRVMMDLNKFVEKFDNIYLGKLMDASVV
jgi:hypothetical protein